MATAIDKKGQRRELADGEVLQDGDRLIVPINLMDRASLALHDGMGGESGHKPGYVFRSGRAEHISDAVLASAHGEYQERLTGAWRDTAAEQTTTISIADGDVYVAYERRLVNAWRSA